MKSLKSIVPKLALLLCLLTLILSSAVSASAQDLPKRESREASIARELNDLERGCDQALIKLRAARLVERKKDESIDEYKKREQLHEQKASEQEDVIKNLLSTVAELKLAGTADAKTIQMLKSALEKSEKEIARLRSERSRARKHLLIAAGVSFLLGLLLGN